MEGLYHHIFSLSDACAEQARELTQVLREERRSLIEFRVVDLPAINLRKESLLSSIVRKRKELQGFLRFHFGVETLSALEERIDEPLRSQCRDHHSQWRRVWQDLQEVCASNQRFLKQSVKSLGLLVDNLKKLLGIIRSTPRRVVALICRQRARLFRQAIDCLRPH